MKIDELVAIERLIANCRLCVLHQYRTNTVPGAGSADARIMIVGEAPGEREDEQGLPFVGRSGQHLRTTLMNNGITRDVFITNICKCRPPNNRAPTPGERAACRPYLARQIAIVQPEIIVVCGGSAYREFSVSGLTISKASGQIETGLYDGKRVQIFPVLHPAAALRRRQTWGKKFEADIQTLSEML